MLFQALWIVVMLGILSVLIIVHEFGHFSVARFFGFQTPVFGFGLPFGPYKVVGHRWGTEFRVHACLLGGYVAIPELGDETNARDENFGVALKPFRKFPIWQRALVAFAGVGFNILFAWLIMFGTLTFMGEPDQVTVVRGLPPSNPIAAQAGIKAGDKIVQLDETKVGGPDDIVSYLTHRPKTRIVMHVMRDDKALEIPVVTNESGKVGMELVSKGPVHYTKLDANPIQIAGLATERLTKLTGNMVQALGMMVQGIFSPHAPKVAPGQAPHVGVQDLHGVLLVVFLGADIGAQDWSQLFLFTIMISLDLAIINLVPWPALDGWHLFTMLLEALRGKPMEERAQGELVRWGFISLLVLMALIMVNDVRSLVSGEFSLSKLKNEASKTDQRPAQDTQQIEAPKQEAPKEQSAPAQPAPDSGAVTTPTR